VVDRRLALKNTKPKETKILSGELPGRHGRISAEKPEVQGLAGQEEEDSMVHWTTWNRKDYARFHRH
jgi:hypothetical protein